MRSLDHSFSCSQPRSGLVDAGVSMVALAPAPVIRSVGGGSDIASDHDPMLLNHGDSAHTAGRRDRMP